MTPVVSTLDADADALKILTNETSNLRRVLATKLYLNLTMVCNK